MWNLTDGCLGNFDSNRYKYTVALNRAHARELGFHGVSVKPLLKCISTRSRADSIQSCSDFNKAHPAGQFFNSLYHHCIAPPGACWCTGQRSTLSYADWQRIRDSFLRKRSRILPGSSGATTKSITTITLFRLHDTC